MNAIGESARRVWSTRWGKLAITVGGLYFLGRLVGKPTEPPLPSPPLTSAISTPAAPHEEARSLVSRAQFGDAWPLTVDAGELLCLPPSLVVLRAQDGRMFALNGTAASRYPSIEPIWARDESLSKLTGEDMRVSIGPLITKGLTLCER